MGRVHLFELHDMSWFPSAWRDTLTDFLDVVAADARVYAPLVAPMQALVATHKPAHHVDLCSGSGGPALWVHEALMVEAGAAPPLVLTDLYPNARHAALTGEADGEGGVSARYEPASIDATALPERLGGLRTIFNAFHHFRPEDARRILSDAAAKRAPIMVVEANARAPLFLVGMMFAPLNFMRLFPRLRSRSLAGALLTYLLPILPFVVWWDGIVSCLRVYDPGELDALCAPLQAPGYTWRAERLPHPDLPMAYLTVLTGQPEVVQG